MPFTTSKVIADMTGMNHRRVKDAIRKNKLDIESFGLLGACETESTGGRPEEIFKLNEEQATFLMTLLKNTPVVVAFKKELVRQFYAMRRELVQRQVKDTDQYVPASGVAAGLHNRVIVHEDTIIYPGPYARFLYYGKLMIDPNTGSTWAPKGATKVIDPGGRMLNISQSHHGKAQSHWFEASKAQNLPKWRNVAGRVMQREFRR